MKEGVKGKIAFINHEKKYALIEYEQSGKKKTVRADVDEKLQKKLKEQGLIKKVHHFLMGDVVEFKVQLSDRGDRMLASNVQFLYNTALDVLINKARANNRFIGYLKIVDDKYFVKEIDSYLFFPVPFSDWQVKPTETELNEQVIFSLENLDKKEKIFASLFSNVYIPEFQTAVKLFKAKTPIEAEVSHISPHGIYLNVISDKIQAKLNSEKDEEIKKLAEKLNPGDKIKVIIDHLSKSRIAVSVVDRINNKD